MDKGRRGFPPPLIGIATVLAIATIWLKYPSSPITDIVASAAGLAAAWVMISFAAYALVQRANSDKLGNERMSKAGRAAWITLAVVVLLYLNALSRLA